MKRIVLGGLLGAGIIVFAETVIWFVLLAGPVAAAHAEQGLVEASWTPILLLATTVLNGLMLAWLYAAIRPRFGDGVATACKAGAFVWMATWLVHYAWLAPTGRGVVALGASNALVAMLGELTGVVLASFAVARVCREPDRNAAVRTAVDYRTSEVRP